MKEIILTKADLLKVNHNFDQDTLDSLIDNIILRDARSIKIWDNKGVVVCNVYEDIHYHSGYAVIIDEEVKHLIHIYDPYSCLLNEKRGLLTCTGHEEVITLWLDNGEINKAYIR